MTIELVLENPLKVPIILTNITLLWKFLPVNYEGGNQENPEQQPTILSNEADVRENGVSLFSLKHHCTTYSYLRPLYSKQCLIGACWSPMIIFFLC